MYKFLRLSKAKIHKINGIKIFFNNFIKNPKTVGSILPSGKRTTKRMVSPMLDIPSPRRILEFGPGVGVFTDEIIKNLSPDDILDIVEVNENFYHQLSTRYANKPQVRIHLTGADEFKSPDNKPYDLIVSGLPFNIFSPELTDSILKNILKLSKDGTKLTQIRYLFFTTVKRFFASKDSPSHKNITIFEHFSKLHLTKQQVVFLNVPPTYVCHFVIKNPEQQL